ncbi:MAG: hypothetical protein NTV48_00760 [Candidatus Vogelbacteria bacterium]|nr:hypothetical protein [Candidatus Vogelbacteria bacterium]
MWFSSSKKDESEVIGIIDIGSSQISGAILSLSEKKELVKDSSAKTVEEKPIADRLIFSYQEKITFAESPDANRFLSAISEALKKVLINLKANQKPPTRFFVFLSSPFFISQTRVINYESERPVTINDNLIQNLLKAETDKFFATAGQIFSLGADDKHEIIENRILRVKLNGYESKEPIGQTAQSLSLSQFLSVGPSSLLNKIEGLVQSEIAEAKISFHTFSLTAYQTFSRLIDKKYRNFVLIDTGGEITDILVVADGVLAEHLSFPKGKNYLIREMAKKMGTVFAEASSAMEVYQNGKASVVLKNRIETALTEIKKDWLASFKEAISRVTETVFLPENFFILGDDPTDAIFVDFIEKENMIELSLSQSNFDVIFVDNSILTGTIPAKQRLPNNLFLFVESYYCDKIYSKSQSLYFL